jgi:hypothetical protein
MKTNRAPWDFNRFPKASAPLNDICPLCGKPCNSTVVVNEKLYFHCGVVKIDIELMKAVAAILSYWDMSLKDKVFIERFLAEEELSADERLTKAINYPM